MIFRDRGTGEITFDGKRASRSNPCWVCGHLHSTQSWCLVDPQRGIAICPRVESRKRVGSAGWMHYRDGIAPQHRVVLARQQPVVADRFIDWRALWDAAVKRAEDTPIQWLVQQLRLTPEQVDSVAVGNHDGCAAFQMTDADGGTVGIKVRTVDGGKRCVRHSRLGVIRAKSFDAKNTKLVVTEGESDLMVAAGWGMNAVARVGCMTCSAIIARMAVGRDVLIVGDNDSAGRNGAERLREAVGGRARRVFVVYPPPSIKDLRAWASVGATRADIIWRIKATHATG